MNFNKDFHKLSEPDVYSTLCALLYALKDNPRYAVLSELMYLLDKKSFIKLVQYFGGLTIQIPKPEELQHVIKLLLLYQYKEIEDMEWDDALLKAGYEKGDSRSAQRYLAIIKKNLENLNVGDRKYE